MAQVDLLFEQPGGAGLPAHLVFGDDGGETPIPDRALRVVGKITGLRGRAPLGVARGLQVRGRLAHGLRGHVAVRYFTDTPRPIAGATTAAFQDARAVRLGVRSAWSDADDLLTEVRQGYQRGALLQAVTAIAWTDAVRMRDAATGRFEEAVRLGTPPVRSALQEAARFRNGARPLFQEAVRLGTQPLRATFQDAYRDRRNFAAVRFEDGLPYSAQWSEAGGPALALAHGWASKYQEARKPPIGRWSRPLPPEPDPCYVPVLPAHLVFAEAWDGSPNLLFVCDGHGPGPEPGDTVVVPVKEVYLTINSAILLRVDNGHMIPTLSMSMSLDVDSWTWSFSAAVPGGALASVQPNSNGDPVVVQATINGTDFRLVLERVARERTFNATQLRVQGRGLAAELDAPYAPEMSFGNTQPRTARQLLDDILTFNGVPIGWDVAQFDPIDWSVPAGAFSHAGTYISALNAVANSVGAYVQPHNTDRSLNVRMRYPTPAWEWAGVTPQFELPAAVTTQESFEWADKAVYNRVFVSGQQGGVLGQYTRAGTAGDLLAPSVVDPLITHADAARQRGRTILSDTGRVATVSLRLPVLAETGIIKPGNFVHYKEGGNTHIGMTRGVGVDVSMPTIYQTLTVETHVEPV
ncbi:hypothetical protein [Comamonas antarctica]|uniref:hypothetical protein n=1 Tax=Comamonas antarctica TaxID=2743470 RepID=UPI0028EA2461|nr:hypothetical protein [Comamonas antarctica]